MIVLLTVLWFNPSFSQENKEKKFVELFYLAKDDLSHGRTSQALQKYQKLHKLAPKNHNINYLLGVSYIFENDLSAVALGHLEYAVDAISDTYDPSSHDEVNAPLFVYYYLVVAYSQNGDCAKAKASRRLFMELYGEDKSDLYTHDADNWIKICEQSKPEVVSNLESVELVTKEVTYSTPRPLYGIQVGSFKTVNPYRVFSGLKNVEAFLSNDGTIRYVVGHLSFRSQAESLLEVVQGAGYEDAFIVDVNQKIMYGTEIISINNISVKGKYKGKIDFRVQIGAFKETIPLETAQQYLAIEGIREVQDGELTTLTVGEFETYQEAEAFRQTIVDTLEIKDAFIVAFNNGVKLDVKTARHYTENQGDSNTLKKPAESTKKRRKKQEPLLDDEDFSSQ